MEEVLSLDYILSKSSAWPSTPGSTQYGSIISLSRQTNCDSIICKN